MNMIVAAVGVSQEASFSTGTAESAIFVVYFAAAGFLLLTAAGRLIRRAERRAPEALRSSDSRR